jgi:hypothetical protein
MAPVEQQRCIPGGCVVRQSDLAAVQQLQGNLGETVSLLQFLAHFHSLISAAPGLEMCTQYTMLDIGNGCVLGSHEKFHRGPNVGAA